MLKLVNEVRDVVHGFIRFNTLEKEIIGTAPFQRLRHINQLALTSYVYPGATHKRFEHSLGVMDLASRVFDAVCKSCSRDTAVVERFGPELQEGSVNDYWRQTLRIAALLHDVGHLPFSHAAEKQLLPEGWNHERLTADIIRQSEIANVLKRHRPQIVPEDVVKLAWDRKKRPETEPHLNEWETVLNEIITGDTFGVDRIDYLLRDSLHSGVSYGRFDPFLLIDNLTIVVDPSNDLCSLAIEEGAMHAAEALLLARYFMYTQVYFHDVRRAYDKHLQQFLVAWLPEGKFPTDWRKYARLTDNEVCAAIQECCEDEASPAHQQARRIVLRQHYRTIYTWNSVEDENRPGLWAELEAELRAVFGELVLSDKYVPTADAANFPVRTENGDVENSLGMSGVLAHLPTAAFGYIFADQSVCKDAMRLVQEKRGRK